jgi:hypothetical protein
MTDEFKKKITEELMKKEKEELVSMYITAADSYRTLIMDQFVNRDYKSLEELKASLKEFVDYPKEDK